MPTASVQLYRNSRRKIAAADKSEDASVHEDWGVLVVIFCAVVGKSVSSAQGCATAT
jgi:hypothetical protein